MEKYSSQVPQTFGKKIINFWYYYKWHLLAGILILCILLVGINSCLHKESVDMYVLYMVNGAYSTQANENLALKLENYIDDLDGDGEKRIQIITISFSDVLNRTDLAQEAVLSRFVGQVATGPALFYVFDEENYSSLKETQIPILAEIDFADSSEYLEKDRYAATEAGFFEDIEGWEGSTQELYFGMRVSDGIPEDDGRYRQISQCKNALSKIIQEYK